MVNQLTLDMKFIRVFLTYTTVLSSALLFAAKLTVWPALSWFKVFLPLLVGFCLVVLAFAYLGYYARKDISKIFKQNK